jgi:hypothetical protein
MSEIWTGAVVKIRKKSAQRWGRQAGKKTARPCKDQWKKKKSARIDKIPQVGDRLR